LALVNLLLLQVFPSSGGWNEPSWSISAEWFTYLFVPLLIVSITGLPRKSLSVIAGLCFTILIAIEVLKGDLGLWWGGGLLLARCAAEATIGIVIYQIYSAGSFRSISGRWVTGLLCLIALSMALYRVPHVLTVLLFSLLILATARLPSNSGHWLTRPVFIYLGLISYSIYMVHWFVRILIIEPSIWLFGSLPGDLLSILGEITAVLLGVVVVVILSHYCYRYVELPWRSRIVNSAAVRRLIGLG
jgi:peptidoglycan/LPS O-acetylase OafA/YrhL